MGDPDLTPEVELRNARERLRILDGLARAMEDPHAVLDILVESDDVETARRRLMAALELDEIQGAAVLDMQFRRTPRLERQRIVEARADIAEYVARLEVELG